MEIGKAQKNTVTTTKSSSTESKHVLEQVSLAEYLKKYVMGIVGPYYVLILDSSILTLIDMRCGVINF